MSSSKDLLASLNPYTTLKDKPGFADIYTLLALRSARFLSYKKAYMSDPSESDQSCVGEDILFFYRVAITNHNGLSTGPGH